MIGKPLVHHEIEGNSSIILDSGLGLSWRNMSVDNLIEWACIWEDTRLPHKANLLFGAALLKENAINNGINLEDK